MGQDLEQFALRGRLGEILDRAGPQLAQALPADPC